MLNSLEKIERFTVGMDFDDFVADDKTQSAVIREFEVIGEASKNIPDSIKNQKPDIPWSAMARMRDKLIHTYFKVDFEIVWESIQKDLPQIKSAIDALIKMQKADSQS